MRTTIDTRQQSMAIEALTREADKLQAVANRAWAKPTRNRRLLDALVRDTGLIHDLVDSGTPEADALKRRESD